MRNISHLSQEELHELYYDRSRFDKMVVVEHKDGEVFISWSTLYFLDWKYEEDKVLVYWFDKEGLQSTFYELDDGLDYIARDRWRIVGKGENQ